MTKLSSIHPYPPSTHHSSTPFYSPIQYHTIPLPTIFTLLSFNQPLLPLSLYLPLFHHTIPPPTTSLPIVPPTPLTNYLSTLHSSTLYPSIIMSILSYHYPSIFHFSTQRFLYNYPSTTSSLLVYLNTLLAFEPNFCMMHLGDQQHPIPPISIRPMWITVVYHLQLSKE